MKTYRCKNCRARMSDSFAYFGGVCSPCYECYDDADKLAARAAKMGRIIRDERNRARRERDQAMRDIGLVKVRGALGGTYWERRIAVTARMPLE